MGGRKLTELVLEIKNLEGRRSERYKEEKEQKYKELVPHLNYRVKETVRRMMGGLPDIEKETVVEDCCSLGVVSAVKDFNPDLQYEFLTFFYRVIKTIISNHMKSLGCTSNGGGTFTIRFSELEQQVEEQMGLDLRNAYILDEIASDNKITVQTIHYQHVCNRIMENLPPEIRKVFLKVSKGYTWNEIRRTSANGWLPYKALLKIRKNSYARQLLKDYNGGKKKRFSVA